MQNLVLILERIAPEALHTVKLRYHILRIVCHHEPVGRRQVAKKIGCSERKARTEIEDLREKGFLMIDSSGICLTDYGRELLEEGDQVIPYLENLSILVERLKQEFSLEEVVVVPGDSYRDPYAKKDLGRFAARYLKESLFDGCRVAVTGGSTLAEVAKAISGKVAARGVIILPSRGGVGGELDEQANVVAARIAKEIGADYKMLYVPDNLEGELLETICQDPTINEMVHLIKSCHILVHGIGCAQEMATRRGMSSASHQILKERGAVGEAIRYYFNAKGEIVYSHPGIGLEFSDLEHLDKVIAVAGGSNKAEAIAAVLRNRKRGVLITDEAAARKILSLEE